MLRSRNSLSRRRVRYEVDTKAMKPTFMIAGCGKCGTTTLASLLGRHPDIFVSKPKEPNFLAYDSIYDRGWEWYSSLFEGGEDKIACGEASVSYSLEEYESKVAQRISRYLPNIKVIYIARNPFKRLESVYREHHDSGHNYNWHMPYGLDKAVRYRPQMLTNSLYWQRRTAIFRQILAADRILYLCLEDLQANPDRVLQRCCQFIGVDPSKKIDRAHHRLNQGKNKMYDTRLMRFIRTHELANKIYQKLPQKIYKLATPILRQPFGDKRIYWEPTFRQEFIDRMKDDVGRFLEAAGKSSDFWGREFTSDKKVISTSKITTKI